jgi:hypothetical protein
MAIPVPISIEKVGFKFSPLFIFQAVKETQKDRFGGF